MTIPNRPPVHRHQVPDHLDAEPGQRTRPSLPEIQRGAVDDGQTSREQPARHRQRAQRPQRRPVLRRRELVQLRLRPRDAEGQRGGEPCFGGGQGGSSVRRPSRENRRGGCGGWEWMKLMHAALGNRFSRGSRPTSRSTLRTRRTAPTRSRATPRLRSSSSPTSTARTTFGKGTPASLFPPRPQLTTTHTPTGTAAGAPSTFSTRPRTPSRAPSRWTCTTTRTATYGC